MAGYPDFQSYPQWRGGNALAGYAQTLPVGANPSGPILTAAWRGVQIRVNPSAGFGTVTLNWFDDAAESLFIGSDTWAVNPTTQLQVIMPIEGNYCDLNINVTSVGAMTAKTALLPSNTAETAPVYPVTNNTVRQSGVSIPISATSFFPLPFVQSGLACFNYSAGDATGKLSFAVVVLLPDGTLAGVIDDFGAPAVSTPFTQLVACTDSINAVRVTNSDATAAHIANVRLVPAGR